MRGRTLVHPTDLLSEKFSTLETLGSGLPNLEAQPRERVPMSQTALPNRFAKIQSMGIRTFLVAVIVGLCAFLAPATNASATDYRIRSWGVGGATVELWYSSSGWNWVMVKGAGGRAAEAGIYSANTGWRWSPSYGAAPNTFGTPAVYAPGSTCVTVKANVQAYWWPYAVQSLSTTVC